jgi:hypothetical protein
MVFLCIVTDVRVSRLELSNIGNYFCHEQDDTVSYCHDASYQAHLSADRGNLTESEQFTALVVEGTDEAKEEEAFKSGRFGVKIAEIDRRHGDEMAAIERLNSRARDVLARLGDKGNEAPSGRPLRKRKGDGDPAISPPKKSKKN